MEYRLCGGTFFTLLCNARKERPGHSAMYHGVTSGLTEPELLAALVQIADPKLDATGYAGNQGAKDAAGRYKKCTGFGGDYFGLGKRKIKELLDSKVKHSYGRALAGMAQCVSQFLEIRSETKKDEYLVKALVALIGQDSTISDEQKFYVCEDGAAMTKAEVLAADSFCLESFLLGVWHYAATMVNNKEGESTFNDWCPENGRNAREYIGTLGENMVRKIRLTYLDPASSYEAMEDEATEETDCEYGTAGETAYTDDDPDTEDCSFSESRSTYNVMNSPTIVYQYGEKNIHIDYVETLNL